MIQPIVEGRGEVEALPVLLRRLQAEASAYSVRIGTPLRHPRSHLVHPDRLVPVINLARRQPECRSIIIVFDGDDDAPCTLAPRVQARAQTIATGIPCFVVMAHREYEAWFLAAIESLRGRRGIEADAVPPPDPEGVRGAKEALENLMVSGRSYHEPADQPAFSALFDMAEAYRRSRSFRRLTSAFGRLLSAEGVTVHGWPPPAWSGPL